MRWLGIMLAASVVACEPVAVPSPSPSSTSSPSPSSSASPSSSPSPVVAREETPRLLLSIPYAPPTVDKLGATTGRVGGITPRGPNSLAVDESERIYIWDRARLRVAVYGNGRFERAIAVPYVEQDAGALLVEGGRLYLRAATQVGIVEYEIDSGTGALVRAVASTGSSIYPRRRTGPQPSAARYTFGADAAGFEYLYTAVDQGSNFRYERVEMGRSALAFAVEPALQKMIDAYPRADGALYELAADYGGVGSVYVYALLAPSPGARPESARPAPATAPIAFGRSAPDRLTATLPAAGSVDLDARSRTAVWWLASLAKERTDLPAPPYQPVFVARWNDGSTLEMVVSASLLFVDGKIYVGPATIYEELAAYALASPSRLAELAAGGATVRMADLPNQQRGLTVAEIAELSASLSKGFSVSEGELPGVLELPFPRYEILIGPVVVRLRGDEYGSIGEGQSRTGAFVHDGKLDDLVGRWLHVPGLAIDDPHSLFLADKVTFEQPGHVDLQDITRWKASLVRALTAEPGRPGLPELVEEPPATLMFRFASGRVETVIVRPGEFTYRGRVIPLRGVMYLVYYRGVP